MISRKAERNADGMVDDERRIEILCERTGCFDIWTLVHLRRESSTSGEVDRGCGAGLLSPFVVVVVMVVIVSLSISFSSLIRTLVSLRVTIVTSFNMLIMMKDLYQIK